MTGSVIGLPLDPDDRDEPCEADGTLFGDDDFRIPPNRLSQQTFDHEVYMSRPPALSPPAKRRRRKSV